MRTRRVSAWLTIPSALLAAGCSSPESHSEHGTKTRALALTEVIPLSSRCQITDGLFTTCADGTEEWSSISAVGFPAPESYVYAVQADLDPDRQSPGSPADTLMLMYDECSRTTPLGPDEFFQVSFSSVGNYRQGQRLEHYLVHVFPDGTIRFIEDGIPHPAGRAREIAGQRGAAGFGQSPNCPFDHLVVEYEIALDAAGGDGYSPDPLWWSGGLQEICGDGVDNDRDGRIDEGCPEICGDDIDNNGNGEADEGCPAGPKILSVQVSKAGPIEMHERYRVSTTIVENDQFPDPVFAFTQVNETIDPATVALGDCVSCPLSSVALVFPSSFGDSLLTPQIPHTFVHPALLGTPFDYQHAWHWMGRLDEGCTKLLQDLVDPAVPILHGPFKEVAEKWLTGARTLSAAATSLSRIYFAQGLLLREGRYDYAIAAEDQHGRNTSTLSGVTVRVPHYKEDALTAYWATVFNATVLMALSGKFPVLAIGGVINLGLACSSYNTAVDPDPNYTELTEPLSISLPEIDAFPDSPLKELAQLWLQVLINDRALSTSLGRYEGAKDAGSIEWMSRQLEAASEFRRQVAQDISAIRVATDVAMNFLDSEGVEATPEALSELRADLLTVGLPASLQSTLTQLGFSEESVSQATAGLAGTLGFLGIEDWQDHLHSAAHAVSAFSARIGGYAEERLEVLEGNLSGPIRPGFDSQVLPGNNDDSTDEVPLGFTVDFLGTEYSAVIVNNNGNLTFEEPLAEVTTEPLSELGVPIIAPFYGDVDTTVGNEVTFGTGSVDGRPAFGVNWPGVRATVSLCGGEGGPRPSDLENDFQVLLVDRSDVRPGDFDIEFNYKSIRWDSSIQCDGGEGFPVEIFPRVGYASPGAAGDSVELPGSGISGAFGDENTLTGLAHETLNHGRRGRYVFEIRSGMSVPPKPDSDRDGVLDELDNCISAPNPDQKDSNLNRIGDECETSESVHSTALFIEARTDGTTVVTPTGQSVQEEPSLLERLALIVQGRVGPQPSDAEAREVAENLVDSLAARGIVAPSDAEELIEAVLEGVVTDPNQPPEAICTDVLASAGPECIADVSIDGGSFDPENELIGCTQDPRGPYDPGSTSATLTCTDAHGATASCSGTITVVDDAPPTILCPTNQVVECLDGGARVPFEAPMVADNCGVHSVSCFPPSGTTFGLGRTDASCHAEDHAGNSAVCVFPVNVLDTQSPVVTALDGGELWPPNHKYIVRRLRDCGIEISDQCVGTLDLEAANATITRVTSDEPENGKGDGNTFHDIVIVDDDTVKLRAERSGSGDGRVYKIHFEVRDAQGNIGAGECRVSVPHDRWPGGEAIDSGVQYEVASFEGGHEKTCR